MDTNATGRKTLADWDWFIARAKPILDKYVEKDGCAPTGLRLRQEGHGWIPSAAGYHGAYRGSLMKMGLPSPDGPSWKVWDHYASNVRPIIQKYLDRDGFPPNSRQLRKDKLGWIVAAAWSYYRGYEAVLKKLGFTPRPLPQTGTGYADPVFFRTEFKRVVSELTEKLKRTPSRREMQAAGFWGLLAATHRNHGGYVYNLRLHGYLVRPGQQRPPKGQWHSMRAQLGALHHHFPEYLRLKIMPPSTMIRVKCPGLVRYWLDRKVKWPEVARRFRLADWKHVATQVGYLQAAREALNLYRKLGRWPRADECSHRLRGIRFRHKTSWKQALTRKDLYLPLLEELIGHWREHVRWIELNQPEHAPERRRFLNHVVLARNALDSPTHSTSP